MSMEHFAVYDEQGRIGDQVSCPPGIGEANIRLNTNMPFVRIISSVDPDEYYILEGKLQLRPKSTAAIEGNVLKGVPAGAKVTIEGQVYDADGSDIELEFEHPGTYQIAVDAFPQTAWTGEYIED